MRKRLLPLFLCLPLLLGLFTVPAHGVESRRTTPIVRGFRSTGALQSYVFLDENNVLYTPSNTKLLDKVVDVRGDYNGNLALREDGTLWEWGTDRTVVAGQGGSSSIYSYTADRPVLPQLLMDDVIDFDRLEYYDMAVKKDHTLWFRGPATDMEWKKMMDGVLQARLGYDCGKHAFAGLDPAMLWAVLDESGVLWNVLLKRDLTVEKIRLDSGITDIKAFYDNRSMASGRVSGSCNSCMTYATKADGSLWGYLYDLTPQKAPNSFFDAKYCMGFPVIGDGPVWGGKVLDEAKRVYTSGGINLAIRSDGTLMAWGHHASFPGYDKVRTAVKPSRNASGSYIIDPTPIMDHVLDVYGNADYLLYEDQTIQKATNPSSYAIDPKPLEDRTVIYSNEETRYDLGDEGYVSVKLGAEQITVSGILYDPRIESVSFPGSVGCENYPFTPGKPFSMSISPVLTDWRDPNFPIDVKYTEGYLLPKKTMCLFRVSYEPDTCVLRIGYPPTYLEFIDVGIRQFQYAEEVPDDELTALSNQIVGDTVDELEKYLLIHQWIIKNISYDWEEYNILKDKQNHSRILVDAMTVYRKRSSVCEGYANLEAALLERQGIFAYKASSVLLNHAWNMVYVHNNWYISDATWDQSLGFEYTTLHPSDDRVYSLDDRIAAIPTLKTAGMNDPSKWAQEEVFAAIDAGVVPMICRNLYNSPMSREHFCRLIVYMLQKATGESSYDFTTSSAAKSLSNKFSDTKCSDILCAYHMGVVNGVTDSTFNPTGKITRQEAAAMLQRAASYLKVSSGGAAETFSDADSIAGWAKDGVDFCSGLVTPEGKKVMGGTGANTFSPMDSYTTEQAIISVYRLYQVAMQQR